MQSAAISRPKVGVPSNPADRRSQNRLNRAFRLEDGVVARVQGSKLAAGEVLGPPTRDALEERPAYQVSGGLLEGLCQVRE